MGPRRSLLFVPGSRPERISKALSAGADMVCVDLEDAVAPNHKAEARAVAMPFLVAAPSPASDGSGGGPERIVRLNSLRTMEGLRDLLALLKAAPTHGLVMLPKVESADEVRWIDGLMTEQGLRCGVIALIETAAGLECASAIAKATPRLQSLMFGGADLAVELGVALADAPLLYARGRLVHAAAQAGIGVLDVPSIDIADANATVTEAQRARELGFTGKACIHPAQVAAVNAAFTPSEEEVTRARRIVEAMSETVQGALVLDGRMVERPILRAAERVLARAAAAGSPTLKEPTP